MCFHGNRHPSSIKHPLINLYTKYQSLRFICFPIMNSPVFPSLDDIYCTSFIGTLLELARNDEIKHGELVGEDKFGNKYYQNNDYMFLRNRWVVFSHEKGWDYDATNIPPEWHRWMHHGTDKPPSTHPRQWERWQTYDDPTNRTATPMKYVPYSTTEPKIEPWTPPK